MASHSQASLGIGKAPLANASTERRFVSAPNTNPDFGVTLFEASLSTATKKRKMTSELTPDNADKVLTSSLDFSKFHIAVSEKAEMTEQEMFALLKSCVVDPHIVSFSSIRKRHVESLGLNLTYDLDLLESEVEAANVPNSSANTYLQQSSMGHIRKHFNLTNESGARCMIDQFLVAGVIYAQTILDQNVAVRDDVVKHYKINNPYVAVFTEVPIPYTKVRCGNTSYTFHGVLDYGIGFISTKLKDALCMGGVPFEPSNALSGIIVAKSLEEFRNATPQITAQVLTILTVTKRKSFTGALAHGSLWRFFTAYDGGTQIRIYASGIFAADKNQGLIVELLKDMVIPIDPLSHFPMITTDLAQVPIFGNI
ncbi:hypothetical protein F5887DRAFT_986646, partial [Amanita rubescens]